MNYTNNSIELIQTEGGRAIPGSSYTYEYFLKDHLGNTRAVVKQDGTITQVQDYYAFGLEMNPGNQFAGSPENRYTYNGKEKQVEIGLDQFDYGARFYDPVIGRWNVIDPLAEQMRRHSTYNYVFNNPLKFTDPDGMAPVNEYEVIYSKGQIESVRYVSDKGGDQTDYIKVVNKDRIPHNDAVAEYKVDVQLEFTSGVGTEYSQKEYPTPGERVIHGTMPAEWGAIMTVGDLFTGGAPAIGRSILGQVASQTARRIGAAALRKRWEQVNKEIWPDEPMLLPDGTANKYHGRKQSVSHKRALADGGTNDVDNIFRQPWAIHHATHVLEGDFKRWAQKMKTRKRNER